jgi:hypothetical protein
MRSPRPVLLLSLFLSLSLSRARQLSNKLQQDASRPYGHECKMKSIRHYPNFPLLSSERNEMPNDGDEIAQCEAANRTNVTAGGNQQIEPNKK